MTEPCPKCVGFGHLDVETGDPRDEGDGSQVCDQCDSTGVIGEPEPTEKIYKAKGTAAVLGHEPGEEFTAVLEPGQEARLIQRGSLEVVGEGQPIEDHEQKKEDD